MAGVKMIAVRRLMLGVLVLAVTGVLLNSADLLNVGISAESRIGYLIHIVPTLIYLVAIWLTQRAYAAITAGASVEVTLATLLQRLGLSLFAAGLYRVFGELLLEQVILGTTSAWAQFDVAAAAIGCVGLLLVMLARPLREAASARRELSEIV